MAEVLLVRHAQALANQGEFAAFGNRASPLTRKGYGQCGGLRNDLISTYRAVPEEYEDPVAASKFRRAQETAFVVGFTDMSFMSLLDEPDFSRGTMTGPEIVAKHRRERWSPPEPRKQARKLLELISTDKFPYYIAFTHGMFMATVLLELEDAGHDMSEYRFDEKRGYVPLQTGIIPIKL